MIDGKTTFCQKYQIIKHVEQGIAEAEISPINK